MAEQRRIAVIGLGYVGLPVALAFAEKYPGTIGFDISAARVAALKEGRDKTGEADASRLRRSNLAITSEPADLKGADVFIVCVPTPILPDLRPDLAPLELAGEIIGRAISKGAIVILESTVYPGATEEFCGPIIAARSGLAQRRDFRLAYSPERINPGDKEHTFEKIVKVVAGEDEETTRIVAQLYASVVEAGVHIAPTIRTAEMAKVIENTQRDLNVALMNELALICDLMGVRTKDVLDSAATKWNFLRFTPGLVGGHCIGVDPYYLTSRAQELGYQPEVILAGRRLNNRMGAHIVRRTVQFIADAAKPLREARVGVLGLTFKENVPDIRNSRVPSMVSELIDFGIAPLVTDPLAEPAEAKAEYNLDLVSAEKVVDLDALILAVPHAAYVKETSALFARLRDGGVFIDVKSVVTPASVPKRLRYWSL